MLEQEDLVEFIKVIIDKLDNYNKRGHWKIIDKYDKSSETKLSMSIWSFKKEKVS